MNLRYFKGRYKEEKRWALQDGKTNLLWKIFLPFTITWTLLWENTMGPLWQVKWRILDFINSRRKRKVKVNTLDMTWIDKDEIILHACFQLLVDFMEKERAPEVIDFDWVGTPEMPWDNDLPHLQELYFWWTQLRPKRIDPYDDRYYTEDAYELIWEIEKMYDEEDQEKLEKLIKYRRLLWC